MNLAENENGAMYYDHMVIYQSVGLLIVEIGVGTRRSQRKSTIPKNIYLYK